MPQNANRALAATRDAADCSAGKQCDLTANTRRVQRPPHLRINGQRLFLKVWYWSLTFYDGNGGRKQLASADHRAPVREAALRFAIRLHVPVRGRWSGFYQKLKRKQAALRERRVAARAAKRRRS